MPEKNDTFAAIAAQNVEYRGENLVEPGPLVLPDRKLRLGGADEGTFEPVRRIADEAALQDELEVWRERYAPFMENHAPELVTTRESVPLTRFDWRIQTREDQQNFAGVLAGDGTWESVSIPHYGPPLGQAVTYYRTTIHFSPEQLAAGSTFVCFKGVDYKAQVFMNGTLVGSHEGFFAPFECDCTACAREGENALVVQVENDYIFGGNGAWGEQLPGDKLYAATGPGYDDAEIGWHHCPPGMGIYQDAFVEFRDKSFVSDIFVRPLPAEGIAELWVEAHHCIPERREIRFLFSVHGRNFQEEIVVDALYEPSVIQECGFGDALQIARAKAAGIYQKPTPLLLGRGPNRFTIPIEMGSFRWWSPETPWLYQVQVKLQDADGTLIDTAESHFGMRSFRMDETADPKGTLFLNEQRIKLRGANTMGHEQQCVIKKDWDQLRDDLLLARICNMNFLRITQRPVQSEVYDYCDMLGLMTQCDLPTFAVIRRNRYVEVLRQVEEMERLVRSHPCNIMVSYINEPQNNSGNEPHRHLSRLELEQFFAAADDIVHNLNPERVIKACDGDYDPPSPGIQDRHCYSTWYNGQGVDIGRLHRGFWQPTKSGWLYGCGEFGAEGLDPADLMRRRYPADWLPRPDEDERHWSPNRIVSAQSGRFHHFFYETPETVDEWVLESQRYQARAMRMMAEAFRRDNRMVTFAIHLFVDAFPSGWMKTIMDCERRPKLAYFAYRDALAPMLPNLRTDRTRFFSGEEISVEAWICNDAHNLFEGSELRYRFLVAGEPCAGGSSPARIESCNATFQGTLSVPAPSVDRRTVMTAELAVVTADGATVNDTLLEIEVFPAAKRIDQRVTVLGEDDGAASRLARELGCSLVPDAPIILADDATVLLSTEILDRVQRGARLVLLDPGPGTYNVAGTTVTIKASGFNPLHFASRRTGHPLVEGFEPHDFRHWFDPAIDYITPILNNTFTADDARPILLSGNTNKEGEWEAALAAGEIAHGKGSVVISLIDLAGRVQTNPPARLFAERLVSN